MYHQNILVAIKVSQNRSKMSEKQALCDELSHWKIYSCADKETSGCRVSPKPQKSSVTKTSKWNTTRRVKWGTELKPSCYSVEQRFRENNEELKESKLDLNVCVHSTWSWPSNPLHWHHLTSWYIQPLHFKLTGGPLLLWLWCRLIFFSQSIPFSHGLSWCGLFWQSPLWWLRPYRSLQLRSDFFFSCRLIAFFSIVKIVDW